MRQANINRECRSGHECALIKSTEYLQILKRIQLVKGGVFQGNCIIGIRNRAGKRKDGYVQTPRLTVDKCVRYSADSISSSESGADLLWHAQQGQAYGFEEIRAH